MAKVIAKPLSTTENIQNKPINTSTSIKNKNIKEIILQSPIKSIDNSDTDLHPVVGICLSNRTDYEDNQITSSNPKLNSTKDRDKDKDLKSKTNTIKWTEIPLTITNKDTNFPGLEVISNRFSN